MKSTTRDQEMHADFLGITFEDSIYAPWFQNDEHDDACKYVFSGT